MIGNHVYSQGYRGFESLPLRNKSNWIAPFTHGATTISGEGFEPSRPDDRRPARLAASRRVRPGRPIAGPRVRLAAPPHLNRHEGCVGGSPRSGRPTTRIPPSPQAGASSRTASGSLALRRVRSARPRLGQLLHARRQTSGDRLGCAALSRLPSGHLLETAGDEQSHPVCILASVKLTVLFHRQPVVGPAVTA